MDNLMEKTCQIRSNNILKDTKTKYLQSVFMIKNYKNF